MPNNNQNNNQNNTPFVFTLGKELQLKTNNRTERLYFSPLLKNGKRGIFTNVVSKTPETLQTLTESYNKTYINIEYNEMLRDFLYCIHDNMDEEYKHRFNDDYNFEAFIIACECKGFIKCKVEESRFIDPSFFSSVVTNKKGVKTRKPLEGVNFQHDMINKAAYSLKVDGVWKKEKQVRGQFILDTTGISITVTNVTISDYTIASNIDEENEEYEAKQQEQLLADALFVLENDKE